MLRHLIHVPENTVLVKSDFHLHLLFKLICQTTEGYSSVCRSTDPVPHAKCITSKGVHIRSDSFHQKPQAPVNKKCLVSKKAQSPTTQWTLTACAQSQWCWMSYLLLRLSALPTTPVRSCLTPRPERIMKIWLISWVLQGRNVTMQCSCKKNSFMQTHIAVAQYYNIFVSKIQHQAM